MKTKVILHGGNSSKKSNNNDKFFYEIINSVDSEVVKILCIYFARPEHRWEYSYAEDQSEFFSLETTKEIETKLATYDMEELLEEIKKADVIFINGGARGHLKEALEKLGNFSELIQGKVLVGISAGANILSKYYFSSVANEIREGIGLLSIKLMTHYSEEKAEKIKTLESYGQHLPVIKIAEEHYQVLDL
jgi:peptidase E